MSTAYDSTNDKVVIAYQDVSNSNYGTKDVEYWSLPVLQAGSAVFESARTNYISAAYGNGKVIVAYQDHGNNEVGTAVVGEVSPLKCLPK